jgi:hypothetical protein
MQVGISQCFPVAAGSNETALSVRERDQDGPGALIRSENLQNAAVGGRSDRRMAFSVLVGELRQIGLAVRC